MDANAPGWSLPPRNRKLPMLTEEIVQCLTNRGRGRPFLHGTVHA